MSTKTIATVEPLQTNKKVSRELPKKVNTNTNSRPLEETFFIDKINLVGNTIFSEKEFIDIISPFEKKEITWQELLLLRTQITNYYIEQGYISSVAFIPTQEFTDGRIKVQIVEGSLEKIDISGLTHINKQYIYSRLPKEGSPLKIEDLTRALNSLYNNSLIADLTATLSQPAIGKNILSLKINENQPLTRQFALTNGYSPSVGTLGGIVNINYHLFGAGDIVNFQHTKTEGLSSVSAGYSIPINSKNGEFFLNFKNADTNVIEEPVSALDIQADYQSYQLGLKSPIANFNNTEIAVGAEFELIRSETFLDEDFSFAFVDGLSDGRSRISALRFVQEINHIRQNSFFQASSQFNLGLDLFNSTINDAGVDALFWSWSGISQWIVDFNFLSLVSNLNIQLTGDKLLPLEQISLGGMNSVRGYRQNLSVGDNGIIGSVELEFTISESDIGSFQVVPFIDAGTVWNNSAQLINTDTIASIGFGLVYELQDYLQVRIDYGIPLIETENPESFSDEQQINFLLLIQP